MFSSLFVCLLATLCKNFRTDLHEISRKVGSGPVNKRLNFGGDPNNSPHTGIVFRICHHWEVQKVVNGHKSAAHTDSPDGGSGKTCLGGGMHCPNASSFIIVNAIRLLTNLYHCDMKYCDAGRSLRWSWSFSNRSTGSRDPGSRDLLQRAVCPEGRGRSIMYSNYQRWSRYVCVQTENSKWRKEGERVSAIPCSGRSMCQEGGGNLT